MITYKSRDSLSLEMALLRRDRRHTWANHDPCLRLFPSSNPSYCRVKMLHFARRRMLFDTVSMRSDVRVEVEEFGERSDEASLG